MDGIEGVAEILEPLAVVPLPPVIHPNGKQRKDSKTLLDDLEGVSEQRYFVVQTVQLRIDVIHGGKLSDDAPPFFAVEEVEDVDHQHTGTEEVQHGELSRQGGDGNGRDSHKDRAPQEFLFKQRQKLFARGCALLRQGAFLLFLHDFLFLDTVDQANACE